MKNANSRTNLAKANWIGAVVTTVQTIALTWTILIKMPAWIRTEFQALNFRHQTLKIPSMQSVAWRMQSLIQLTSLSHTNMHSSWAISHFSRHNSFKSGTLQYQGFNINDIPVLTYGHSVNGSMSGYIGSYGRSTSWQNATQANANITINLIKYLNN